jgi:uncharacterized protein (DUF488 family)
MDVINKQNNLFTIGCSIHTTETFINILKINSINVIVDVRSTPFSKHTPQFNADLLKEILNRNSIYYLSFANEFGARRIEQDVYTNSQVDFEKVKKLPIFISGVERIKNGLQKGYHIALMCTEKDPVDCHRFSLVSRGISELIGINSKHILFDGSLISTEEIERRLIKESLLAPELFNESFNPLPIIYKKLEKSIAYKLNDEVDENYE